MKVAPRFLPWAAALTVFAGVSAYGITFARDAYESPIFASVRFLAPLSVWATVWLAVAIFGLFAATFRWPWAWIAATVLATFAGMVWWAAITWEAVVDHQRLSWTGWGLWFWFAFTNIRVGFSSAFVKKG